MVQTIPPQFGFETLKSALPRGREGAARRRIRALNPDQEKIGS